MATIRESSINATTASRSSPDFPYNNITLTACYLVATLQLGYYLFYILFMGTDAVFKASRAFDYEDFDCQRKAPAAAGQLLAQGSDNLANVRTANNANAVRGEAARGRLDDQATATATATADSSQDCHTEAGRTTDNKDQAPHKRRSPSAAAGPSLHDSARKVGGDGVRLDDDARVARRQISSSSRRGGSIAVPVKGGRGRGGVAGSAGSSSGRGRGRGPLHRLMQHCSCMLVYSSDDEDLEDEDSEDDEESDEDEDEAQVMDEEEECPAAVNDKIEERGKSSAARADKCPDGDAGRLCTRSATFLLADKKPNMRSAAAAVVAVNSESAASTATAIMVAAVPRRREGESTRRSAAACAKRHQHQHQHHHHQEKKQDKPHPRQPSDMV